MSQNDLILLNQLLEQRLAEIGSGLTDTEYFEVFSAEQVLKDEDLSYDEIESGVVGGGGDGGVDSFYFFVNGTLYSEDIDLSSLKKNINLEVVVIQSKTSSGFSEESINKFISATKDLFDLNVSLDSLAPVYNDKIRGKVAEFRAAYMALAAKFPTISFRYAYVAKAIDVNPNVRRKVGALKETLERMVSPVLFSFEFIGATDLLALARKVPTHTAKLTLSETPISTGQEGFVCLVGLKDFLDFIKDENGRIKAHLFEGNVRDYQGNTEVNKEIRSTLETKSEEDFWWLNNGVSMLCSNASLAAGKVLTIEDPEIVNGLQTSREIFEVLSRIDLTSEKRNLLVRVLKPSNEVSRDRIIKATNSQTAIPPASLHATDKIHRDVEDFLAPKGLYYDRRKNHYKNAGKPVRKIISIPFMAQAVMACGLCEPANARARPSTLIKNEDAYRRIFNADYPLEIYYTSIQIVRKVEDFLRTTPVAEYRSHSNNLRFYISTLVVLRACALPRPAINEVARLDLLKVTSEVIAAATREVYDAYAALGATDQIAKGPNLQTSMLKKHAEEVEAKFRAQAKQI